MSKIIGIDLGTTNSCVAVMEGKDPVVIPNAEGKRTTPSIVAFTEDGERKVGDPAKRQAVTNPKNTIYSIKRYMGTGFSSLTEEDRRVPYELVQGANNTAKVKIDGREYTPQEISAMTLQKMKKTAEDYLGQEVTRAVITVPAYFNDAQRQATKEAGEIAGLKVERIINEPTAAALAYGLDKNNKDQKIAVYDLGNVIINWLAGEFQSEEGVDLKADPIALQRLKEAAEKAKIELSASAQTEINLPYITATATGPKHLVKTLTRAKFEQLSADLVRRSMEPCKKALQDAGLSTSDIDEVILVGGSTRIPIIQEEVEKFFGKKPSKGVNPDEVVAVGAAIQGGVLTGDVKDVLLLDVTPLSLGIETMGSVFTKVIDANTPIPTRKSEVFSTAADNQPSVTIRVGQGERPMFNDNKEIGRFDLTDIPPAPRGVPQIEVTFDIDANGILSVSAKDKGTGKEQSIKIQASSGLSDEEIERMKKEAQENASADAKRKEEADLINKADGQIFQTEKQLKEFGDKISADKKSTIETAAAELKTAFEAKDIEAIKTKSEALDNAWMSASEELYKAQAEQQQGANPEQGNNAGGDNVQDADFEEVK